MARRGETRTLSKRPPRGQVMHQLLQLIEGAARYEVGLIATEKQIPAKDRAAFIARHVGRLKQVRAARAILAKGSGSAIRKRLTKRKEGK